jgi:hypothetical protein
VTKEQLVESLASYVSGDDIVLDRVTFLRHVAARIEDDAASMQKAASAARAHRRTQ